MARSREVAVDEQRAALDVQGFDWPKKPNTVQVPLDRAEGGETPIGAPMEL